jgi:hypothetical protein
MINQVCSPIVAFYVIVAAIYLSSSSSVDAYNILIIPSTGKSHVFAMVSLAEGLAARGHSVTVLVSKGLKLHEPEKEAARQRGIHYERVDDGLDDYDAMLENMTKNLLFNQLPWESVLPFMKSKYAC